MVSTNRSWLDSTDKPQRVMAYRADEDQVIVMAEMVTPHPRDRAAIRQMLTKQVGADYVWWEDESGTGYDPVHGPAAATMKREALDKIEKYRRELEEKRSKPVVYDVKDVAEAYCRAWQRKHDFPSPRNDEKLLRAAAAMHKEVMKQTNQNERHYHIVALLGGALLGSFDHYGGLEVAQHCADVVYGAGNTTVELCETSFGGKCKYEAFTEWMEENIGRGKL